MSPAGRTYRVSELGRLTAGQGRTGDVRVPADFPFAQMLGVRGVDLCDHNDEGVSPFGYVNDTTLTANGRVGVVEVNGHVVELLPKTWSVRDDPAEGRRVLETMLESYVQSARLTASKDRRLHRTRLHTTPRSVGERIFQRFTEEAHGLFQTGVRFGYSPVSEQRSFLRGRLDFSRQVRQPPGREHRFHIRHTHFHPDRPENRLIKAALLRVATRSHDPLLRTQAHQLAEMLTDVPASQAIQRDFTQWDRGRLLAHYGAIQPWCQLVLKPLVGLTAGSQLGDAWLFRTDRLFERHLEMRLRARLRYCAPQATLITQDPEKEARWHLGQDASGKNAFQLLPDFVIASEGQVKAVLDAKWKTPKPGGKPSWTPVSREDAFQMHAYGHRLLKGDGVVALVYPATPEFTRPVRHTLDNLRLVAIPFDITNDRFLVGDGPADVEALGEDLHNLLVHRPSESHS